MTSSNAISRLPHEFDGFLFAEIGEEGNGMLLSVLSGLARMNLDPWQEAAKLANLPRKSAIDRLTALIEELPDEPSAHRDSAAIALRLIQLLPQKASVNLPSADPPRGVRKARWSTSPLVIFLVSAWQRFRSR